jgi:hypothetical protein
VEGPLRGDESKLRRLSRGGNGYGSLYLSGVAVSAETSSEVPLPVNLGLARGAAAPDFCVLVPLEFPVEM